MTARILVHADGGACHGTPIVDGRCPKCGIAPDTQSTELWPQPPNPLDAGVISDMERPVVLSPVAADRVAALIEERPGPTEAMRAMFAERRPCAGWVDKGVGGWRLKAGDVEVTVHRMNGWSKVFMSHAPGRPMNVESDDVVTVLLAAEDALRAVAAEILRAVGS